MNPLEDPQELGRRIAAARGYAGWDIEAFGARISADLDEVRRWEAGLGLGERIDERRVLAERVAGVTGAPRLLLGLDESPSELVRRIEVLEAEMARVQKAIEPDHAGPGRLGLVPERTEAREAPRSPQDRQSSGTT